MYKAKCKVEGHDGHELKSNIGEDLQDWKKRMESEGHKVEDIYNSDYKVSDKGYKLIGQVFDCKDRLVKLLDELDKQFEKIEGLVDHQGVGKLPDKPETTAAEIEPGDESSAPI